MGRRKVVLVFGVGTFLFLVAVFGVVLNVPLVRGSGTIYIRADGSIDPPTAPITTLDNGTYTLTSNIYDNIIVQRGNITIDGAGYTLQGDGMYGTGFFLAVSNVTIKGTNIKNFGQGIDLSDFSNDNSIVGNNITNNGYGIQLSSGSSNNNISGNNITENSEGIYLYISNNNSIVGNNITKNWRGVYLRCSSKNRMFANNIISHDINGIYLYESSDYNSVFGNNITENGWHGIELSWGCSNNDISGNNITENYFDGIRVWYLSDNNTISGNSITGNQENGIQIGYVSDYNSVFGNNITRSSWAGIQLSWGSSNNNIHGNNITGNPYGIHIDNHPGYIGSNNEIHHNNFIDNSRQAYINIPPPPGYADFWDDDYPSGGNYWSDYTGVDEKSGPDQDEPRSDGIGDTPYVIATNNQDHYPLMAPWPSGPGLHELKLTLKAPARLLPANLTLLEATVHNNGFYNEENVTIFLFVNNTVVNSTTISLLEVGSSYTISYHWTPEIEGVYNVAAYTTPVTDEIYIANNNVTILVTVGMPPVWNVDTGLYYDAIQEAIDAPETLDGHTIRVESGTYYEHVIIGKSIKLVGEDRTNTIIDGNKTGTFVVRITASNVVLSGFTIQNSDFAPTSAICIYSSNNVISNNTLSDNGWGIYAFSVSNNTIENNVITNNVYGINLEWVTTHTVNNNTITNHQQAGIYLRESRNNVFTNNIIEDNKDGIVLISYSNNNKIYHNNFIENTSPGFAVNSDTNAWDDGYPSGGNYWSDYTDIDLHSGPYQNETGSDGIGDTPYTFSWPNQDNYPLMNPIGSPQPPIANFAYMPEHPVIDETITFNASTSYDRDGFITSCKWDFGDGNITTVADLTITHVYETSSTYIINLTVTDNDGFTHSITMSITVEKISSTITVNVDPTAVIVGSNVTINGTITPIRVDVNVTIYYRLSGGTWTTLATVRTDSNSQYTYTWKTKDTGTYEIKANWLGDENTSAAESNIKTVIVAPSDSTPPTTTISLNGVLGNDEWFTSNVTVTLLATDDISGVDKTEYSFDNTTWAIYTTPFNITTEGNTIIYYKSTDKASNVETIKKQTIKIDKTAPSGSIIINNGDAYTTSNSVTLTLTVTDVPSGVYQVRYSNDGTNWTAWEAPSQTKTWTLTVGDETKTVYFQIKDNARLISDTYSDIIILDTTPPTGSILIAEGATYTNSTSVALNLSADDETSGVAQMRFSHDNTTWSSWEAYSTSKTWVLTTGDGTKTVYVEFMDNAGLISQYQDTIVLDTVKPTADAEGDQTVNEDTVVTFNGSSSWDENGIASYTWTFTNVIPQTLSGENPTYNFTTPGTYNVTLTVTDPAGNAATDTVAIAVLLDTDGDRTPDITDLDDDNDGVPDVDDAFPFDASESMDTDGDGVGNNADTDDDNDGMPDSWETSNGLNPLDTADASLDPDGDGITNLEEYQHGTDPNVSDAETLPTEAFPLWILGVAAAAIGTAVVATFLWKRRK